MAQFVNDPTINTPICTATTQQYAPQIINDGAGGYIIVWYDQRSGNDDVYVQKINSSGVVQWTTNGVPICTLNRDQYLPQLVTDGAGGAIITWQDERNGGSNVDIYAQRINAAGVVQWTPDGVAICSAGNNQSNPQIATNGANGAIITWMDLRSSGFDVYAQQINAAGTVQWTVDGVGISTAAGSQFIPQIVSDGSGGAVITWQDGRSGNNDVYAQKINTSGMVQWTLNGVAISSAVSDQTAPQLTSDGAGGAIITWQDFRSGTSYDIYAQKINTTGTVQWTADGVGISTTTGYQQHPQLTTDGAAGAIITWDDQRNGSSNTDIYAQRINTSGSVQWTADGVSISAAVNNQNFPWLISDGSGGAIITWQDQRTSVVNTDVYAQKINSSGMVQLTADGAAVSTATNNQTNPRLTSNGAGGAVVTWEDARNGGSNIDIYAQNIQSSILPLKWLAFVGEISMQNQTNLRWKVEEMNVVSYQVERNSGTGFSSVATIASKGDGTNSYNFTEAVSPPFNGCQYRIKQTDIDGKLSYSAVLSLTPRQLKTIWSLHPNPVNTAATLQYKASAKGMITYTIIDAHGRKLLSQTVPVEAGINAIPLKVNSLAAGIYTLVFQSSVEQSSVKLVKE